MIRFQSNLVLGFGEISWSCEARRREVKNCIFSKILYFSPTTRGSLHSGLTSPSRVWQHTLEFSALSYCFLPVDQWNQIFCAV